MEDRELLERAAKAAGIQVKTWEYGTPLLSGYTVSDARWWNPLVDDGDAFRLAVKLDFDISRGQELHDLSLYYVEVSNQEGGVAKELEGDDPYAATRRAIVRAAALSTEPVQKTVDNPP